MTIKEQILSDFDKCIEDAEKQELKLICITVLLMDKYAGEAGIGYELLIIDKPNFKRKREYFNQILDDDGYYQGTDRKICVYGFKSRSAEHSTWLISKSIVDVRNGILESINEDVMDDAVKEIYQDLKSKYNKSALTKQELANELGMSLSAINYNLSRGINLPNYKKLNGVGKYGKVLFPIHEVAKYLSQTNLPE